MSEIWIMIPFCALFALFLGRAAVLAFWPDSDTADFCEHHLGFMDRVGDSDGSDGDCGGGDGGD